MKTISEETALLPEIIAEEITQNEDEIAYLVKRAEIHFQNSATFKKAITAKANKGRDNLYMFMGRKCIGKLTDITESQYKQWVEGVIAYGKQENHPIWTAKKAFFSYLESQKILFEDKLGEFPTKQNTGLEYGMEYISKVQRWEEEQEKVWVLSNCYLFQILN